MASPNFQSTVSVQKLRRLNTLALLFRAATFCFSLAASLFTLTNNHSFHFDALRFLFAANAIVALYSIFQMGASVWEISRTSTLFPEFLQVWFDFGHDQVFAYMLVSANSGGTALGWTMRGMDTCTLNNAFCLQSDIAIALGFAAFLFLAFSTLLSGFRLVCFIINGSRFHL